MTALDENVRVVHPRADSVTSPGACGSLHAPGRLEPTAPRCFVVVDAPPPTPPLDCPARHGWFLAFEAGINPMVRQSRATEAVEQISAREQAGVTQEALAKITRTKNPPSRGR